MNKKPHVGLFRGLAGILSVLLSVSIGLTNIANAFAGFINPRLGTTNLEVANTGGIYFTSEFTGLEDLIAAKEAMAEEISAEGSVLLKNNGALPLNISSETVTLWGMNSHFPTIAGMIGSSASYDPSTGQKSYGIEEALAAKGFTVNETMKALYASEAAMAYARKGWFGGGAPGTSLSPAFTASYEIVPLFPIGEIPADLYTADTLSSADGTAAIVVISRDSSEAADYSPYMFNTTEGDAFERPLALSNYERDMIALAKEHSSKVIVLLNADNPVEIEELKNDNEIDAILWVGAPGMYGFLGVADVLSGAANPSGHLPDTYAVNSTSSPAMQNFGLFLYSNSTQAGADAVLTEADKGDWYVVQTEGIYTGYKYYETRYEDSVLNQGNASSATGSSGGGAWNYADEVSYPFGYGLSYTTFEQKLESVNLTVGGEGKAVVTVKNTGSVAGKSVVQLYVQTPYTKGGLEKAAVQLLDFAKTDILQPGKSATVEITFDPTYMASYDESVVKADGTAGAWVLDAGDYYFAIGNGAHAALNNVLALKTGTADSLVSTTDADVVDAECAAKWTLSSRDVETYSENVQNALQNMDINKLIEGAAEYITRADWTKGWKTVEALTPTDEMMVGLTNSNYTLTKNGDAVQWGVDNGLSAVDLMVTDPTTGLYTGVLDWDDPKWDQLVDQITLDDAINFILNGGDDFERIESISLPALINKDGPVGFTYDQVGGYAVYWDSTLSDEPTYVDGSNPYAAYAMNTMPTEPIVAATFNKELVEREGELFGEDGLWANLHQIAGPGLNLHRTPYCARNHEYYSEDAMLTNLMGVAVSTGCQSKGLAAEPKHYAFNFQELNRSGLSTFMTEQTARENELRGFQGSLSTNVAEGLMTAFNRAGTVYAGAHSGLLEQILRTEWGYKGYVVSDMINGADYMNWRDTVAGGGLICLTSSAYDASNVGRMDSTANIAAIKADANFQMKMKEGLRYFVYAAVRSATLNNWNSETKFVHVMTWWQKALIGVDVVIAVLDAAVIVMYFMDSRKVKTVVKE